VSESGAFEALLTGRAFVDLSPWRKISVTGNDAFAWLNDLVSADLTGLRTGQSRRSLLLSPTGHIRADFTVLRLERGFLLLQDSAQPQQIDELLERYVLSSDVALEDRTEEVALFALPSRSEPPDLAAADFSIPSCLGDGIDALVPMDRHADVAASLAQSLLRADMEDVEAWRIFRGIPRFGVDVTEEDLPQEGALEEAVSFNKGCYVGQEAVAKVRNLGHPRRLLLHMEAATGISPGEPVCVDGTEVGRVTSTVRTLGGTRAFARVRWAAKGGPFTTAGGAPLAPVAGGPS
jgi:folate-binding protein YgfZ